MKLRHEEYLGLTEMVFQYLQLLQLHNSTVKQKLNPKCTFWMTGPVSPFWQCVQLVIFILSAISCNLDHMLLFFSETLYVQNAFTELVIFLAVNTRSLHVTKTWYNLFYFSRKQNQLTLTPYRSKSILLTAILPTVVSRTVTSPLKQQNT